MSESSNIFNTGNSEAIPGHVIHFPAFADMGTLEDELAAAHMRIVSRAMLGMDDKSGRIAMTIAQDLIAKKMFTYGMPYFNQGCYDPRNTHHVLRACLAKGDPKMTSTKAEAMLNDSNRKSILDACMAMIYPQPDLPKNSEGGEQPPTSPNQTNPLPSTSGTSSEGSAGAATISPK